MECQDCASFALCPWLRTDAKYGSKNCNGLASKAGERNSTTVSLVGGTHNGPEVVTHHLSDGISHDKPDSKDAGAGEREVRTYRRRWLMLGLFSVFSLSNAYMWIHLNIIANVVQRFYNDSLPDDSLQQETAVDWLSLVYMLAYLVFIPLGMYVLNSRGLRVNSVVGCAANALGAWLKCGTTRPSGFPLLMAAQTLCGFAQVFIVSIPPRLAAVWFGPNEVSTATGIGVFGNQLGVAVGFLFPPLIVPNSQSLDEISRDLGVMFYGGATVCTLLFLLMLFVFQNQPPHPPSRAQLLRKRPRDKEKYYSSILRVMRSPSFLLLMISYGLITGCYYAISTLLNFTVLHYFPGEEVKVGYIGLVIIVTGIFGSVLAGFWLDRSKYFKSTSVAIYLLCTLGMVLFTFTLSLGQIWVVFVTAGVLGFFMTGYLPVGYEFAAEITYPEPEGVSSGLLTTSAMLFGIVMTLGMRAMMNQISVVSANIFVSVILLVGTVMTGFIKSQYNRQEAEKKILVRVDQMEVDVAVEESKELQNNQS